MKELISVIINVYNREKFISKCLESVLNQTYKNLEIIIVNDGSTDNTLNICKSFKDSRIKIITTKNQGLSLSRNVGIASAKGEYLYFVDSDDFIENDTIEYLYNLCKKYNLKFSTCKTRIIYDYDYKIKNEEEKIDVLDSYGMLKNVLLAKDFTGTTWNKLIKKDLFDDIRFENRIINDIVVTYKLVLKAKKIVYSNQKKYYYLKHSDAITMKEYNNYDRSIDLYKASLERYNYIKNIYPNFIENDLGLIRNILKISVSSDNKIEDFLKKEDINKCFNKISLLKLLRIKIDFKLKSAIILYKISPKLYKSISKKILSKKYKFE